jgi:threonylcarbamoyladenosine tRNA methylthiotransferase MtaB
LLRSGAGAAYQAVKSGDSNTRVHITTLGCKVNQCDAAEMAEALAARGYTVSSSGDEADVHMVNTCTVTATADAKARKLIRRLARGNPQAAIVVTGCWAQIDPRAIAALPEVDAVVPNTRKWEIADIVANFRSPDPASAQAPARTQTRVFLKVQDGCDQRCAYCIVPDARGEPRSKPVAEVLERAFRFAGEGVQEIVLCGIRLGAYGRDHGQATLAGLLRELRDVGIPRLRLSSIEPMDYDGSLLAEIAENPAVCRHFHLPMQSGDDSVLTAMGRPYASADYVNLVGYVRSALPDAAITTDIIVAFPGESDEQYRRTIELAREVSFSRIHVFPFSARPDTPAAARSDQVPEHVKRSRTQRMLALADGMARLAAQSWVDRPVSVLFEERDRDGMLTGLTPHYVRVRAQGPDAWIGRVVDLVATREAGGELVADG